MIERIKTPLEKWLEPEKEKPFSWEFNPFSWDIRVTKLVTEELAKHGEGLFATWRDLASQKPPEDIIGKVIWFFGVMGQMFMSLVIFPASLGAFLMEETVQTAGMGAYILSSSRNYDLLDEYLPHYFYTIELARIGAINMTILSPVVGGAALQYMDAAALSWMAFRTMTNRKLIEQAELDEELRLKLLEEQIYGELRLSSTPSMAEIWIDSKNTEYLTPQTFKNLDERDYIIELRKYNTTREEWDIYMFTASIEAGRRKEIHARIPPTVTTDEEIREIATTGMFSIKSTPSSAEIWFDDKPTLLLTPETFKDISPGLHKIKLLSYSRRLDVTDKYEFEFLMTAGLKLELKVNIPGKAFDAIRGTDETDETDTPKLGEFVKAEVTGDYAADGDTFRTTTGERIRILGIDAPETGRPWADEAEAYLDELIRGKNISLKIQSSKALDTFGRTLAICKMYKGDIAELILSAGLARLMVFPDDIYDPTSYELAEQMAKDRKIGIWSLI